MEFFKIWQTRGGVIGVNRMSLADLIGANIMVVVVYFALMMLVVQILPVLLLSFYVILLLNNRLDSESTAFDTKQRLAINVLTVISVIYFLLDFHFGWVSFKIFSTVVTKDKFDAFATLNLSIGLVSIFLFFLGHEFFKVAKTQFVRLLMFGLIVFLGIKLTKPFSRSIITNTITQCSDANIQKNRDKFNEQDAFDVKWNDTKENTESEEIQREIDKDKELRDFDKEYADKYLKD